MTGGSYAGTTGPTYPLAPSAGTNALGQFQIGASPVGDIQPFNLWDTVVSQYANSPILTGIIQSFDAAIDQTYNFEALFDNIWSVDTAVGYGLDAIGRRVGVTRVIAVAVAGTYFGFKESTTGQPFNQAPFWNDTPSSENYLLSDAAFRNLILAKALSNISDGSILSINKILLTLFPGRGNAYVVDTGGMRMVYRFEFALSPVELSLVQNGDVLPKPAGVATSILTTT